MLRILMAVGLALLLIVSVNVINLLLARMTSREREIAIRLALGAGRFRLIRQFLRETLLIALFAGAFGVFLAFHGVDFFSVFEPNTHLPLRYNFTLDRTTLAFTAVLTLGAAVIIGLAPALQLSQARLAAALTEGGRGLVGGTHYRWFRNFLVIAEVSMALLLLIRPVCVSKVSREPGN